MEEQYLYDINNYSEEQKKRYDLIGQLQRKEVELSYSWIKEMLKSPKHFLNYKLKERDPQTEAMIFGSLVDCLITEPENLNVNFIKVSKIPSKGNQTDFANAMIKCSSIDEAFNIAYKQGDKNKIYKLLKEYIDAIIQGLSVIDDELLKEAENVRDELLKETAINLLLDSANSFQTKSIVEYKGWKIKRFTDVQGVGVIIDLKLMSQLNPEYVDREVFKMNYDLQGAIYTLDNMDSFFNICYDRKGNNMITEYDESTLSYGRDKLDYCLNKIEECCENPELFNESYNFHDLVNDKLGIKTKKIYKPGYAKSYRL